MPARLKNIARWIQTNTNTDLRYLGRGGFWVSISHSTEILSGIIVTVALANLVPKETMGTYQYVLATSVLLSALTLTGMRTALIRAVAQGNYGLLRYAVITKLKWNIGIVLSAAAIAAYYFYMGNNVLGNAFLIVGTTSPFLESFRLYQAYLVGAQKFKFNAFMALVRRGLPTLGMVMVVLITTDVLALVLAYFSINLLAVSITLWLTARSIIHPPTHDTTMAAYSKHLSVTEFIGTVTGQADKLLLWHFLGPVAVATFTIAQLPIRYTSSSIGILNSLVLPKLAQRDFHKLKTSLYKKILIFSLLAISGSFIYILLAPWLFSIVFPSYTEAISFSQALALGLIFVPITTLQQALTAHQKMRALYTNSIINNTIKIILLVTLLPLFGIWGAIYSILITQLIGAVVVSTTFLRTK